MFGIQWSVIAATVLWTSMAFSANDVERPESSAPIEVNVIGDSLLNKTIHQSTAQIEFRNVSLQDLAELEVHTSDGERVFALDHLPKIDVTVFIPENLDPSEKAAFLRAVETQLNQKYNQPHFKVRELVVPSQQIVAEAEALQADVENSQRPALEAVKAATANTMRSWAAKTKAIAHKIKNNRFNSRARDLTMGALIGLSKSAVGVSYWVGVTGLNVYGLAQAALSVGLDSIFHIFPVQINRWKSTHEILVLKDTAAVKFYNSSPLVKAFVVNQTIHFVCTYVFRLLSYLNDPEKVVSPNSVEFLSLFGGLAAIGTPLGAAGDMGVRTLARKGYISGRTEHYIFNLFGLEMQINGLLFGSGRTEWLPVGLAVEWGGKAIAWAAAKMLPAKKNRLVIVHPEVVKTRRNDVPYLMGMEDILAEDKVREVALADLLSSGYQLNCSDYLKK